MTRQTKSFAILLITLLVAQYALLVSPAHAQDPPGQTPFDPGGLIFETVNSDLQLFTVMEDREGFIWLGEGANVFKYDGYQFESIAPIRTGVLFEDSEGMIWMGAQEELFVYDKTTDTLTEYPLNTPNSPSGIPYEYLVKTQLFAEAPVGRIWIGTGNGLNSFDKETGQFTVYQAGANDESRLLDNNVYSVMTDHQGFLWVGTATGVHTVDPESGEVIERYAADDNNPTGLHGDNFVAMVEDSQGNIWIGGGNGINRLDHESGAFSHYNSSNGLTSDAAWDLMIAPDKPHLLWIATSLGLNILNMQDNRITQYIANPDDPQSIISNLVNNVIQDRSGILWVVSVGGLQTIDPGALKFRVIASQLARPDGVLISRTCSAQYAPDGSLWFSAWGDGGIQRYDPATNTAEFITHDPDNPDSLPEGTYAFDVDEEEDVFWVIGPGWMAKFDYHNLRILELYETEATATTWPIVESPANPDMLYASVKGQGLLVFNKVTGENLLLAPDPDNPEESLAGTAPLILDSFVPQPGVLWVLHQGTGYDLIDTATNRVIRRIPFDEDFPLTTQPAFGMQDSQGNWWLGPHRYDPDTDTFTDFTELYGYEWPGSDQTNTIVEDRNGILWFGEKVPTSTIVRLDPATGDTRVFGLQDGVAVQTACVGSASGVLLEDGEIMISGALAACRRKTSEVSNTNFPNQFTCIF